MMCLSNLAIENTEADGTTEFRALQAGCCDVLAHFSSEFGQLSVAA